MAELSDEHLTSSDAIMYHTSIMAENLVKILITPAERNDMLARELLFLIIKLCSVPHTSHGDEIDKRDNYYYNFEHDLKAGPKTLSSTSSQSIVLHSAALIDATKRKQGRYQSATQNRKEHGHKRTVSFVPVVLINKARRKLMRLGGKDNHDENKIGAICAQAIPNISMVSSSGTAPVVERVKRHRGSFFLSTDAVKGDISNKALDVLHSYALYKIKSPGQSSVDHGTIEIESSFSNVRVETNLVTVKIKIFIEGTVDISIDVPHPSLNIPANAIEEKNDDSSKDVRKTDALPLNGPKRRRAVGRGAIFDSAGTNTSDAPPALPDEPPNTYIPSDRSTEIRASGIKMFIQLLNATSDSVRVVVDNSDLQCCMSAALINIFLLRCVEDPRRLELDRSIFDRINSNATSVEARQVLFTNNAAFVLMTLDFDCNGDILIGHVFIYSHICIITHTTQDILDASVAWLNKSYLPVNTKLAIQTNFDALRSLGKLSTNNSYMKYIAEKHRHVVVVLLGMAKLPEVC